LDKNCHEVSARKVKHITINEKNVTTLFDRYFSATGKLEFLKSNIGELLQPVNEDGTLTLATISKTPLKIGNPFDHIIYYKAWDSFTEQKEFVSSLIIIKNPRYGGKYVLEWER